MHRLNLIALIAFTFTTASILLAQISPPQTAAKSPQPIQPIRRIQINKAEVNSTPIAASSPRSILQIQRLEIS